MPLAGRQSRAPLAVARAKSPSANVRFVAVVALAALAGCGVDSSTAPTGPDGAPAGAIGALASAVSTPLFPGGDPGVRIVGDARGLNAAGDVTGSALNLLANAADHRPYRWTSATGAVPLVGCCDSEWGADINDAGVVVGTAQTDWIVGTRGFVATGTATTTLPALAGASDDANAGAVAVNNAGQIVGFSPAPGSSLDRHAVLWGPSLAIQDLGTLGGSSSAAIDVNAAGQVIGWSQTAGNAATHYFLWSAAAGMQDLATIIGPTVTAVVEINDAGQIIGTYVASNGRSQAFLYTPGSGVRDLGTLGGATSAPTGLNNKGQVVGMSLTSDGSAHAFLWSPAEGMADITAISGIAEVRRLNDNLQTLTGTAATTASPGVNTSGEPRLVQLSLRAGAAK